MLLGFFMTAQHLSKEHRDAHLGIAGKETAEAGTAISTGDDVSHELRCVSPQIRGTHTS